MAKDRLRSKVEAAMVDLREAVQQQDYDVQNSMVTLIGDYCLAEERNNQILDAILLLAGAAKLEQPKQGKVHKLSVVKKRPKTS